VERDDVRLVNGCWELREGIELVVPENVRTTILERVARLSPPAQQVLATASALGQTFLFDDLLAARARFAPVNQASTEATATSNTTRDPEEALEVVLEEAMNSRLLREVDGSKYAFSHALTQRALYAQMPARRRRRLHAAIAETIESKLPAERSRRVSEVAYHFLQAEESARALPYLLLAGDQAQTVYANTEAEQHFRTAARLALELGSREEEAEALERLGSLYWWNFGDYGLAMTALEQAVIAQQSSDAGLVWPRTAGLLARAYARCGEPDRALSVLSRWLDREHPRQLCIESLPPEIQASLATAFADLCFHTGAYQEQREAARRAVEVWREQGDRRAEMDALILHGIALRLLGQWEEGLATLREVVTGASDVGALYVSAHASYHVGYSYLQRGDWEESAATIEVALDLGMQSGNWMFYGSSSFLQGLLDYQRGDWVAARSWFEQVQRYYGPTTRVAIRAYAPYGRGLIRAVTGELEEGVRCLQEAISICEDGGLPFIRHRAERDMAEVELVQGQAVEACARLKPIVQAPGCEQYNDITPLLPLLAWACLELGDESQAEELLARAAPQAEAQRHNLALLDVSRIRGLLYARQKRWQEGRQVLEQALSLARSMLHPYAEAKLLYASGRMNAACGNTRVAREHFMAALTISAKLGEQLYARLIEREVSALGTELDQFS
jgi:tetratricopeptide (TPR) repeat protein